MKKNRLSTVLGLFDILVINYLYVLSKCGYFYIIGYRQLKR